MALTGWDDISTIRSRPDNPPAGGDANFPAGAPPDSNGNARNPRRISCPPGTTARRRAGVWECVPNAPAEPQTPTSYTDEERQAAMAAGASACPNGAAHAIYIPGENGTGDYRTDSLDKLRNPSNWRCNDGGGGGGGGGGGPSKPTVDISGFMQPDLGVMALYGQRTPLEERSLAAISALADMMGGGADAYNQAINYWSGILQGDSSAIMPTLEDINAVAGGARSSLERSGLRGGVKDYALADLNRTQFGTNAQAIQRLRPEAATQLGQLGLAGTQTALGAYSGVAEHERNRITTAAGLEQNNRQLIANTALAAAGLEQTERLTNKQLDIQQSLGFAGLALQRELGFAGLDLQKLLGLGSQELEQRRLEQQNQQFNQALNLEREVAQGQKWSSILGSIFGAAGTVVGGK